MRRLSLWSLLLACLLVAVACGGGGDDEDKDNEDKSDLFPNLTSLGLERGPVETIPVPGGVPAGYRIEFAVYGGAGETARAEIRTYPSIETAKADFPIQVAGWKSPVPGAVFPVDLQNVGETPIAGADEAQAFVSSRADSSGNKVWTDIYRVGTTIVVAHTLTRDSQVASKIRTEMAREILSRAR